jgi:hypothetical protein
MCNLRYYNGKSFDMKAEMGYNELLCSELQGIEVSPLPVLTATFRKTTKGAGIDSM